MRTSPLPDFYDAAMIRQLGPGYPMLQALAIVYRDYPEMDLNELLTLFSSKPFTGTIPNEDDELAMSLHLAYYYKHSEGLSEEEAARIDFDFALKCDAHNDHVLGPEREMTSL